jgi:hypothetical protein
MSGRPKTPPETVMQIRQLAATCSADQISRLLNVPKSTIWPYTRDLRPVKLRHERFPSFETNGYFDADKYRNFTQTL